MAIERASNDFLLLENSFVGRVKIENKKDRGEIIS